VGVPLDTIRSVLAAQTSLTQVTEAHLQQLDLQIRTLRLRRAVLRAVAKTESTAQEAVCMHTLVTMSEPERQGLIDDFLDDAFGDLDANPDLVSLLQNIGAGACRGP
jgi:hypothetical protein